MNVAASYQKNHSKSSANLTNALLKKIEQLSPGITVGEVNASFCRKLANKLKNELKHSSATSYLQLLRHILDFAVKKNYLKENNMPPTSKLLPPETTAFSNFLTKHDLEKLIATPCGCEVIKSAFLFACFTGLRISDIERLKWSDIQQACDDNWFVIINQKKTSREVRCPLTPQAVDILNSIKGRRRGLVFRMKSRPTVAKYLNSWAEEAGIGKKITFHTSRHTYATMLYEAGVELPTICKLCGHKSVSMTLRYTHFSDSLLTKNAIKLANYAPSTKNLLSDTKKIPHSKHIEIRYLLEQEKLS